MLDDSVRLPRIVTIAGAFSPAAVGGGGVDPDKKQKTHRSRHVIGPSEGGTR